MEDNYFAPAIKTHIIKKHVVYPTYEIDTRDEEKLIDEVKKILQTHPNNEVIKIRITFNRL